MDDFRPTNQQKDINDIEIIAVDGGCGFRKTETDLKRLFGLSSLLSKDCSSHGLLFVCSYFYRILNGSYCNKHWPTRDQCKAVKSVHCQSEWKIVESLLQSRDYCISAPACTQLPAGHQMGTETMVIEGFL